VAGTVLALVKTILREIEWAMAGDEVWGLGCVDACPAGALESGRRRLSYNLNTVMSGVSRNETWLL